MTDVDVVVAGGGSDGAVEAGALAVLRTQLNFVRIGGASAGAINALAEAAGIESAPDLWRKFLTRGDLEDWHYPSPLRPLGVLGRGRGMMAGKRIRAALAESFGRLRMGDLKKPCRIVVGNLAIREIEVIDSDNAEHKDILVVDAACCSSAVPFVIDAQQLRPTQRTLYTDGGTGANVPAGMFDDVPGRPTLILRFANSKVPKPVITLEDFAAAIFDIRQDAANRAMPSTKSAIYFVELPASDDSLDFSLTMPEVDRRIRQGRNAASAWVQHNIRGGK